MRNSRLLWTLALVMSVITSTASVEINNDLVGMVRRQNSRTSDPPSPTTDSGSRTTDPPTGTGGGGGGGKGTSVSRTRTGTRINPNSPPGGVQMQTPSIMDPLQLYPIGGDPITFAYNYTSLIATPTAVNIDAFCSLTQQYYSIAHNYSVDKKSVTWDTGEHQATATNQLPAETYTLFIYDSAKGPTGAPTPGYLATFNNLRFALYTPRGDIPLEKYECPTCSAAAILNSHGVHVLLGMGFVTAVSFALFIAGVV